MAGVGFRVRVEGLGFRVALNLLLVPLLSSPPHYPPVGSPLISIN